MSAIFHKKTFLNLILDASRMSRKLVKSWMHPRPVSTKKALPKIPESSHVSHFPLGQRFGNFRILTCRPFSTTIARPKFLGPHMSVIFHTGSAAENSDSDIVKVALPKFPNPDTSVIFDTKNVSEMSAPPKQVSARPDPASSAK